MSRAADGTGSSMWRTVFEAADIPFPEGDALRDDCESEVMVSPVALTQLSVAAGIAVVST